MGSAEIRVVESDAVDAGIYNPQATSHHAWLAWVAGHEGILVLGIAPLLLFPTPATVGLAAAWRVSGRWVPAGAPGLAALGLLGMAAVGQAISLDPAVSLPRLAGLLLGLALLYGTVVHTRRMAGGRGDPLPPALLIGGLGLA